tara:strand:- start:353 stop:670 length:318 start_codon:yes stop_codon:yes gene_type:complete
MKQLNEFLNEGKNKDKKRVRMILGSFSTNAYSTLETLFGIEKGLYIPEADIQKVADEIGEYLSTDVQWIVNLLQSYVNDGSYLATGNYISGDDLKKIANEIVNSI